MKPPRTEPAAPSTLDHCTDVQSLRATIAEQAARDEALTARVAGLLIEREQFEGQLREQAAEIERLREWCDWQEQCPETDEIREILAGLDSAEPDSLVVDEGGVVAIYERSAEPTSEGSGDE